MTSDPELPSNVVPFPTQLRVVPLEPAEPTPSAQPEQQPATVDHDGQFYDLAALIRHLSPAELRQIGDTLPRSGQELWDEVVRHWPALASEIVAGVGPLS